MGFRNYFRKIYIRANSYDAESDAEAFVNSKGFTSNTPFLIWVDLKNFKTNVFKGRKNQWTIMKSYLCSIGKMSTPTPRGYYKVGIKGLYFGVNKGYKCWYYTQFLGNYLFHSVIYNLDGTLRDGRLGMKLSDGCIRLSKENAKWIFDNIPKETSVIIA